MAKKQNSFIAFIKAILGKWVWLMGSIIGLGQTTSSLVGFSPNFHWAIGIAIFIIFLFIAMYLAYRDLYIKLTIEKPKTVYLQEQKITSKDMPIIMNLITQMEKIHGHDDYYGIKHDLARYSQSTVMELNCSICGKPRNQKGDFIHE